MAEKVLSHITEVTYSAKHFSLTSVYSTPDMQPFIWLEGLSQHYGE
jgi:hypothetical protein